MMFYPNLSAKIRAVAGQHARERDYWLNKLSGPLPVSGFPRDPGFSETQPGIFAPGDTGTAVFGLTGEVNSRLIKLSQGSDHVLHIYLTVGLMLLLEGYTGNSDIIVGTPIYRQDEDKELINRVVALRCRLESTMTVKEVLLEVRQTLVEALENQNYPLEMIIEKLNPKDNVSEFSLFDTAILLEGIHDKAYLKDIDVNMIFCFTRGEGYVEGLVEYNAAVYRRETIEQVVFHFQEVLNAISRDLEAKTLDIDILSPEERRQLLWDFNRTTVDYPRDKTIHQLFAEQVERTPDNIAVVGPPRIKDRTYMTYKTYISYRELNEKSNRLARVLREKGIKPDTIVGVMMMRSVEMIIGILGILKAGGAYLPIDPEYPRERIDYMLKDSSAGIFLKSNAERPGKSEIRISKSETNSNDGNSNHQNKVSTPIVLNFEHLNFEFVSNFGFRASDLNSSNLAYVIYTSGSTGKSKGAAIEHQSLVNYTLWGIKNYLKTEFLAFAFYSNVSFDLTITSIFLPLLSGNKIVVYGDNPLRLPLEDVLEENVTDILKVTPSHLKILEQHDDKGSFRLKQLIVGGEELKQSLALDIDKKYQGKIEIWNEYGPTEATIGCMIYRFDPVRDLAPGVPIGLPINNVQIYILDNSLKPVPMKVAGEIFISGDALARGYLNNPELTAEKFILATKTQSHKDICLSWCLGALVAKLYKTGDLARRLGNGNIEFLGRIDQQVKIKGYRIEPAEIENRLTAHEQISEAVVVCLEDKNQEAYLCAYVVFNHTPVPEHELREYLSQELPLYMIPRYFPELGKIPLTANGKLNRQALPNPEDLLTNSAGGEPPRDELEETLVKVWQETLKIDKIGINDNFFALGGDSIQTIQVAARLQQYRLKLDIKDFLLNPTIKQLREFVIPMDRRADQGIVQGEVPLTPIQKWFFENDFTNCHHYNHAVMLYRSRGFDQDILKGVFSKLVEHHDALQMVFEFRREQDKKIVVQKNRGLQGKLFDMEVFNFEGAHPTPSNVGGTPLKKGVKDIEKEIQTQANKIQKSIDLEKGPLVKLGLFKTGQGDHLLIVIHHLVVDGISWRILLEDAAVGYQQVETGEDIVLPEKTDSFRLWSQRLNQYAQSPKALSEADYWRSLQEVEVPVFPRDHQVSIEENQRRNNRTIVQVLSREQTGRLLKEVNQAYHTEINDILLTALAMALREWTGLEKVWITLEGHGREPIIEDINISRTVGWFTAQYPVLLDMSPVSCFQEDDTRYLSNGIRHIKETLRRIPNKGIGYGILRYCSPKDRQNLLGDRVKPLISFNYLGQFSLGQDSRDEFSRVSHLETGDGFSPEMERTHVFDISAIVERDRLNVIFSYNRCEYNKKGVTQLAESYRDYLLKVIDHCTTREQGQFTPSDLGYSDISLQDFDRLTADLQASIGTGVEIRGLYPLSPMQWGILNHWLKKPGSPAYMAHMIFHIKGIMDRDLLEESLKRVVQKHDMLRCVFRHKGLETPLQMVLNRSDVQVDFENLENMEHREQTAYLEHFIKEKQEKGFDLSKDVLIRFFLFKTGHQSYRLVWFSHHILMDGWSVGIVIKDLLQSYHRLKHGKTWEWDTVFPYKNYIQWLGKQDKQEGLRAWRQYLEGYQQPATLIPASSTSHMKNEFDQYEKQEHELTIEEELAEKLNQVARKNRVTINTLFQTLWGVLLQKYNNCRDVVYGAVVSGRSADVKGIEHIVGLFINTVPVRITRQKQQTFSQLLQEVAQQEVLSRSFEYLPLAEIQTQSRLKRDLIDHVMVFENYPIQKELGNVKFIRELGFEIEHIDRYEQGDYHLGVIITPGKNFNIVFNYNALVYKDTFIKQVAGNFRELLEQVAADDKIPLENMSVSYDLLEAASNVQQETYTDFGF